MTIDVVTKRMSTSYPQILLARSEKTFSIQQIHSFKQTQQQEFHASDLVLKTECAVLEP